MHPKILARRLSVVTPQLRDLDGRIYEALEAMRSAAAGVVQASPDALRRFEIWLDGLEAELRRHAVDTIEGVAVRQRAISELSALQRELDDIVAGLDGATAPSGQRPE